MAIVSTSLAPNLPAAIQNALLTGRRSVTATNGPYTNAAQNMFTVAGGPVYARIVGIVMTSIGGTACNGTLQEVVVTPAGTVTLSTTVSIASKAAGTSIHFVGSTGTLTPVTAGAYIMDPVTVDDTQFFLPIGAVQFLTTAIDAGLITWYMDYIPLSSDSIVSAT